MADSTALYLVLRWVAVALAAVGSLWFLNLAVFSAWQTATPSGSEHVNVWAYSAYKALGYSVALVCAGLFAVLNLRPGWPRIRSWWSAALAFCLLVALIWPRWWHFWEVDACLDGGGAWNAESEQCVH